VERARVVVVRERAGSQGVAARVVVGSGLATSGGMGAGLEPLTVAGLMAPAAGTVVRAGPYECTRTV